MSLLSLPIGKDAPREVHAVIEIPKGSSNKYEYDLMRSRYARPLGVVGLLFVLAAGPGPSLAALRAGAASVEITPPVGVPLGGYSARNGRPSTGVHDPLFAKALALDDGAGPVAIVTTDLIGISAELKRRVAEKAGFPPDRLLLCASHTHSGPGAFSPGLFASVVLGAYDPKVLDLVVERIASAARQARDRVQPATVGAGSRELGQYLRNRRAGGTLTDPELTVLAVRDPRGKELAAVVNYTAHGTVLGAENMELSADWMGAMQAELERRLPGAIALYTNGAEGDQAPSPPEAPTRFARSEAMGRAVAAAALDLLPSIRPMHDPRLQVSTRSIELPQTPGAVLLGSGSSTVLQAIGIGGALLIGIPGEPIAELGLKMKRHARSQNWSHPIVVGLANDHLGYLLTEAEFRKGGYEATVSFFGPTFGDRLADEATRLIDGVSGRGANTDERRTTTDQRPTTTSRPLETAIAGPGETQPGPQGHGGGSFFERLSMERLARVHADVEALRSTRVSPTAALGPRGRYRDYRAILHAHSHFSHDSRGTEEEIVAGAKAAGVSAIFMTDHYTPDRRFLKEGLRGVRDGVLFIPGTELSVGLLAFRLDRIEWPDGASASEILARLNARKGVGFIAHPELRTDWDALPSFTGMEIYNTHADAEGDALPGLQSMRGSESLPRWVQLISAFRQYPQEAFASIFDVPKENLARWDRLNETRRVVGIAGNDSHNNVGFIARADDGGKIIVSDVLDKKVAELSASQVPSFLLGGIRPTPGQTVMSLRLDPYPISFGYVSTHILAEALTERDLLRALDHGRCYVAFDWIADPTGFGFEGSSRRRTVTMGDTMKRGEDTRLTITSPLPASLRLLRSGRAIARESGTRLEYTPTEPGVYRAEIWVSIAGEDRPWIYANPIRVE